MKISLTIILSFITLSAMSQKQTPSFNYLTVEGTKIFYREAGKMNKKTILFLHGFPSTSHMYRDVMTELSASYHVIAPDYPGFGMSDSPTPDKFEYSFDHIALLIEKFIDQLGIKKLNLYVQDYGGPIGFRIASKRPELINSLIIQNANAYVEGLGPDVQEIGKLQQANDLAGVDSAIAYKISWQGVKDDYVNGSSDSSLVNPDSYNMDSYFLEKKGAKEIQFALFKNYHTNFPKYPEWQKYFRDKKPNALIIWGKNDQIFITPGAKAYLKDLPNAELHILHAGHFALEEHWLKISGMIHDFLQKN